MKDNIKMDYKCTERGANKSDYCYSGYDRRMADFCKHGSEPFVSIGEIPTMD
jgi:hypothetical protein